jgi:hypothetical protein
MKKELTNAKLFRKITKEHNSKTGFNFVFPVGANFSEEYAHPVHDDGVIVVTSQMDATSNKCIYGLTVKVKDISFRIQEDLTYDVLKKAIATDDFNYRLGAIKQLRDLRDELESQISILENSIIDSTITAMAKEDTYDLTLRAAKQLYKDSI